MVAVDADGRARLVRAMDGEVLGEVDLVADEDDTCNGSVGGSLVLVCETGAPVIGAHSVDDGLEEVWRLDAGVDVQQVAVGGDQLFVLGENALIAFS